MNKLKTARPRAQLVQGRKDWYSIKNQSDKAVIYIYDEIGYFGISSNDFVRELQGLKVSEIELHLNTPGGEVFDGIAIFQVLKDHTANVTTYVDSLAASIGSVIAMAGNKIIMGQNAQLMIHDGHGICVGNAQDMRELADLLDRTSDNIASVYAARAGGSVKDWRKSMRAETWYSAGEAVQIGLADEISGAETVENSWDLSIFNYAGRENAPEPTLVTGFDSALFKSAVRKAVNCQ